MLFLSIVFLYLTALKVGLADTSIPACKPPPSSCAFLPAFSTEICSDIIASQSKTLSTCFVPAETDVTTVTSPSLIKTTTVITATTTTETSTSTISKTQTKHLPVIGALYTTTVISATQTTIVFTTVPKVQTKPQAVTTTITIPATKTAKTTSTWAQQSCDVPVDRKLRFKRDPVIERGALPLNCYCFLTTSSTSATTASRTVTTRPLTTTTITKLTGGKVPTATKTLLVKETTTTQTTIAAVTSITTTVTKTRRSKVTETWQKTKFSTTTTTSEYTKTATTRTIPVSTVQVNPCGPTSYGRIEIDLPESQELMISNEVALSGSTNIDRDCCNACYNTLGCVYWAKSMTDGSCLNFKAIASAGCSTPQCPNGFPQFSVSGQDDQYSYFAGPCGISKFAIIAKLETIDKMQHKQSLVVRVTRLGTEYTHSPAIELPRSLDRQCPSAFFFTKRARGNPSHVSETTHLASGYWHCSYSYFFMS
uniref:Apple domain-containing protein n=1 Tax=Gibberella zeae TaxID=5518 RepID=A0A4E9EG63_GIBZA